MDKNKTTNPFGQTTKRCLTAAGATFQNYESEFPDYEQRFSDYDWRSSNFGDRKSLSIAKNHPKPSQEFSEQFGPSIHKMKGFSRNSPQKVHPNFAQNLGRQILGNTLSGLKNWNSQTTNGPKILLRNQNLRGQRTTKLSPCAPPLFS